MYVQRSPGTLPSTALHHVLQWILEQLNFGNFVAREDSKGEIVSLTIGKEAAQPFPSGDEAIAEAHQRLLAVNVAGVVAQCRESGVTPTLAHLTTLCAQRSTDWGHRNAEFHYAFELIRVLARLNKKTFNLDAPPIDGFAPASVVAYLRESTRCWLYGFHGASVALCRACLEEALKYRLPNRAHAECESLVDFIRAANKNGIFDDCMARVAQNVRAVGNRFLHGEPITERESRETLDATRSLVEQLFAP